MGIKIGLSCLRRTLRDARFTLVISGVVATAPALAQSPPRALAPLVQCKAIGDAAARLACYDTQVEVLTSATARNDVMVVDRSEVQSARRQIFGLTLPALSFLDRSNGGSKREPLEIQEINAKIASAKLMPRGNWSFILDDGARWIQTEPHEFPRDPKAGMKIRIRKAAVGSYLANVDGQIAVRVTRER